MIKKILHITSWFPNKSNPKEALWIKRHIETLEPFCENTVWHIRTIEASKRVFVNSYGNEKLKHFLIGLSTNRWLFIEIMTFIQLLVLGLFNKKTINSSDVINFHIAYPNLTYWKLLRWLYNKPVVITEHWSAYHFNFGVKKSLPRIVNIFNKGIPLITVSEALGGDIKSFSGTNIEYEIIPNVVDTTVFNASYNLRRDYDRFFMVSQWNYPKQPIEVMESFRSYLLDHPMAKLIIGGYGSLESDILCFVDKFDLNKSIEYLGVMDSLQIAHELNRASAFIHISGYETFSVVCAEALCCGCPVIASKVGGIKEFVNKSNGVLVEKPGELSNGFDSLAKRNFDSSKIAESAHKRFSKQVVGQKYYDVLKRICSDESN